MSCDKLAIRHDAHVISQITSCAGDEHAMHRSLTGKVLYYCNCGFSSGWVDAGEFGQPTEFFDKHRGA